VKMRDLKCDTAGACISSSFKIQRQMNLHSDEHGETRVTLSQCRTAASSRSMQVSTPHRPFHLKGNEQLPLEATDRTLYSRYLLALLSRILVEIRYASLEVINAYGDFCSPCLELYATTQLQRNPMRSDKDTEDLQRLWWGEEMCSTNLL
jgi:hypothetical protein